MTYDLIRAKTTYETFTHLTKSLGEGFILFMAQKLEIKDAKHAALADPKGATNDNDDALRLRHIALAGHPFPTFYGADNSSKAVFHPEAELIRPRTTVPESQLVQVTLWYT